MRRALVVLLGLAAAAPPAAANPVDTFGFGSRAPAMGNAQTAATADAGANYYNPAAIVATDEVRIDLGYQLAQPYLSLNGGDQNVDPSRGFAAGISAPGQIYRRKVALGIAFFLPDERLTRARTLPAQRPRWSLYDNRPQRLFIGANLAVAVTRNLFLGAGLAFLSRTEGTLLLEGRVGFPDYDDSDLTLDMDVDLITVRYPNFGVLYRPTPWLDVGAAYRGEYHLTLDQTFVVSGDAGPAVGDPVIDDGFLGLRSVALDLFQPRQVALGFAARLSPRLLVSGDLVWQQWSDFDNPSAMITLDYDLKEFNEFVNITDAPPPSAAYFHDIVVPHLGLEYLAAQDRHMTWRLRAGYVYEPSPAPAQDGETNFVDNDKHTLSAGLGVAVARVTEILPRPFDIDLYVAATFLPEREHRKLSAIDPVGDFVSEGFVFAMGLGSRWHF